MQVTCQTPLLNWAIAKRPIDDDCSVKTIPSFPLLDPSRKTKLGDDERRREATTAGEFLFCVLWVLCCGVVSCCVVLCWVCVVLFCVVVC